jgi:hypothetical protein
MAEYRTIPCFLVVVDKLPVLVFFDEVAAQQYVIDQSKEKPQMVFVIVPLAVVDRRKYRSVFGT